ncbi:hypothetical protein EVAR_89963_1 [Eumeta japonica]|uniref:Uncharacterized protein n=1 Tax=Eumeta variegata TaxID=151549 RepID=A0A4C2A8I0_EUMVA|nr:hypothetical protein EVAR_89963_1 [Eumeta japonica]
MIGGRGWDEEKNGRELYRYRMCRPGSASAGSSRTINSQLLTGHGCFRKLVGTELPTVCRAVLAWITWPDKSSIKCEEEEAEERRTARQQMSEGHGSGTVPIYYLETTAKGTGLGESAGKEDPVELALVWHCKGDMRGVA